MHTKILFEETFGLMISVFFTLGVFCLKIAIKLLKYILIGLKKLIVFLIRFFQKKRRARKEQILLEEHKNEN